MGPPNTGIPTRNSAAFTYSGGELDPTGDGTDLFHRTPGGGLLAYETPAATTFAYSPSHHDLNGLIGSDGNLTDSRTYDPYGDPVAETGSTDPVLGYQSDYTDPVTEHVWMGARWYQPSSATFLSRDTVFGELRTPFSLNRYTYAVNNPIGYWDPDGRQSCTSDRECSRQKEQSSRQKQKSSDSYTGGSPGSQPGYQAPKGGVPQHIQDIEGIDEFGNDLPDPSPAPTPRGGPVSAETAAAMAANHTLRTAQDIVVSNQDKYGLLPNSYIESMQQLCERTGTSSECGDGFSPYFNYPSSEALPELGGLFHVGPVDLAMLILCETTRCEVEVLVNSRRDISGDQVADADALVLSQILEWSGAVQVDRCGESGSGSPVYCAAVTRLPSMDGATALTIGHYILYDIHDGKNMTTTQDGNFNLRNADPGLLAHELAHVDQWEEFGAAFIWDYLNDPETWECAANDASPLEPRGKCS